MVDHKKVEIYDPFLDETVGIDEGIAPLIKALWDLDIRTVNSCQENRPGIIWIEFQSSYDLEEFLLVAIPNREGLLHKSLLYDWDIIASVEDIAYTIIDGEVFHHDPPEYCVGVSVRFPADQYEAILKNVCYRHSRQ
jgi:hypothetical protein